MDSEPAGTLVVFQDRQWAGDPRIFTMTIYVDGARAGKLPPLSRRAVSAEPGQHSVRIRMWWYRSPPVDVSLEPGETIKLHADVPQGRKGLRLLSHPWTSLILTKT